MITKVPVPKIHCISIQFSNMWPQRLIIRDQLFCWLVLQRCCTPLKILSRSLFGHTSIHWCIFSSTYTPVIAMRWCIWVNEESTEWSVLKLSFPRNWWLLYAGLAVCGVSQQCPSDHLLAWLTLGVEKFHSLSSSEPLRRTLLSVTKMLGNIWQSWLAILFPRTSDFHPQATGFQRSAFAVNLAVGDPFWLFWPPPGSGLGFSKRLHQNIVLVIPPRGVLFQLTFVSRLDLMRQIVFPTDMHFHLLGRLVQVLLHGLIRDDCEVASSPVKVVVRRGYVNHPISFQKGSVAP